MVPIEAEVNLPGALYKTPDRRELGWLASERLLVTLVTWVAEL
jgi:hypothetical protein